MNVLVPALTAILWLGGASSVSAQPASPEYCVSVAAGGAAPAAATSRLAWDQPKVELDAKLGQAIVRTSYRFANVGNLPVSIVDIAPSCGCVATQLDKLDFAPGENGEMLVTLNLAMDDAVGPQERFILVTTSDAPKTPAMLRLSVRVPLAVETSAKEVTWKVGEAALTKEIIVRAGPGIEDMKLSSGSNNPEFSVKIKPDADGRRYYVSIAPTSTVAVCYAQIQLEAESSLFRRPITCNINANVN